MKGCLTLIVWFIVTVIVVAILAALLAGFGFFGLLAAAILGPVLTLMAWGYALPNDEPPTDRATREDVR